MSNMFFFRNIEKKNKSIKLNLECSLLRSVILGEVSLNTYSFQFIVNTVYVV